MASSSVGQKQPAPDPLLPASDGGCCAEPEVPLTSRRRCLIFASWLVFIALLLYGSGVPVYIAILLQQLGSLPTNQNFLFALFPGAFGQIKADETGYVDLIHPNWLAICIPWFLLSMVWEAVMIFQVLPERQRPAHVYRVNDTISSLSCGILFLLVAKLWFLNWAHALYGAVYSNLRVTGAFEDMTSPVAFWCSLVAADILYYVGHRSNHYFSWMWLDHVVHHSSEEYNLSTALRQPAVSFLTPDWFFFTFPMAFFFPPALTVLQGQIGLMYQFWIHTQLVPPLPTFELIFNSPSLHRIHHARNLRALGKNYGSILSVWDRIGGTFESELADPEPLYYGVIPPLNSWNPLWANLHHVHHMIFTQPKWHGWKTPFVHWTPPSGRTPRLGSRLNPYTKYDQDVSSPSLQAYIILEFVLVTILVMAVMFVPLPASWDDSATTSAVYGAAFLAVLGSLMCIAFIESASSQKSLRRALMLDGCRHVVLSAIAMTGIILSVGFPEATRPAIGVALYVALHGICFAAMAFCTGTLRNQRDAIGCGQ